MSLKSNFSEHASRSVSNTACVRPVLYVLRSAFEEGLKRMGNQGVLKPVEDSD